MNDLEKEKKSEIQQLIFAIIRILLKVFYILPIKKNRILFNAYHGRHGYNDSPKYICEYLHNNYPGKYEMIWIAKNPKDFEGIEYIKTVKHKTFAWIITAMTSKVFVSNDTLLSPYIPKRDSQLVIAMWHAGGAYKTLGVPGGKEVKGKNLVYASSCEAFTEKHIHDAFHFYGEIMDCGVPRSDIFFDSKALQDATVKVKKYYGINDEIVVLYAPTFRGDMKNASKIELLDFDRVIDAIKRRYNTEVRVLFRTHYYDTNNYQLRKEIVDARGWNDMQELLCASDILITDYSSSMWDFALMGKPCLLYMPDKRVYEVNRGFATDPNTWPGIICETNKELIKQIETLDEERCKLIAKEHLKLFKSYETGTSTKQIVDRIVSFMK